MSAIALTMGGLSLIIWVGLLWAWGQFWRADQQLEVPSNRTEQDATLSLQTGFDNASSQLLSPTVCVVIPARNEADVLPITVRSLLQQDYPGEISIIVVDDHSTDGTADVARAAAQALHPDRSQGRSLQVLQAAPLPSGWTGKLWALEQGTQLAMQQSDWDFLLLTDADIEHDRLNLRRLVTKAKSDDLELASVMVRLRCESFWEKFLIPAFVFFFQKLYPFPWVNDPHKRTAAAAGGCILIRPVTLKRIGGIAAIRQALIDDCALAQAVKAKSNHPSSQTPRHDSPSNGRIWLGLSTSTRSLRPYPDLKTIWDMVARTAYTQLYYSPLLLVGTLFGMILIYLLPPLITMGGAITGHWNIAGVGLVTWGLMAIAYWPTVRFYGLSAAYALCLPAIAFFYTLMTLDSAIRHWRGQGGSWKGRVYSNV